MEYSILNPAIPVLIFYLSTYGLYRKGMVSKKFHVNLWNLILLLAFIISGLGGFILLILLESGLKSPFNHQLLFWHVEAGLALILITIFHFHCYRGSLRRVLGVVW